MKKKKIWILLADDGKGRFIERDPDLETLMQVHCLTHEHPSTHEHGPDHPGRNHDSIGGGRHPYNHQTDWHTRQKEVFARDLVHYLEKANEQHMFDELRIFAPPQMLGYLRQHIQNLGVAPNSLHNKITKEVDRDLTHYTLEELEDYEFKKN